VNNYEFCAEFAAKRGRTVLDYGCGQGLIVELLLKKGVDAYGCDVFYEGGNHSQHVPQELRPRVLRMDGNRIPFPDAYFDVVTHNQVFEHVPDLDVAVSEIARVLKPGAIMLALFPDSSCWREGHCGVPFLHWFPKGNLRVYYALAFRAVGLGHYHGGKSPLQWAQDFCNWIDTWTYYRSYREIRQAVAKHFENPRHIEAEWFDLRKPIAKVLPAAVKQFAARRMVGLVFWCQKTP
jgi:ubiquinone/menaquinone biosynthesis C-methylase UbiE